MKLIILVIFLIPLNYMAADMMYVPNVAAAFNAQNIVSGEVVSFSEEKRTYEFVVDDSFKGAGISNGQTITIHQPRYGALQINKGEDDKKYLLYLTKTDKGYSLYSRTQNVYIIKDNFIPFKTCGKTHKLRDHEFRKVLQDLFKCFEYESMYRYRPKVSRVAYYSDDQHHHAVLNFYDCNEHAEADQFVVEPPEPEEYDPSKIIHDFCEIEPQPVAGYQALIKNIQEAIPDSLFSKEDVGRTRWYIQFIVEQDSSISNIEMAKSFNAKYDSLMLNVIEELDVLWVPGRNNNKPVRCKAVIPVIVRLE